MKKSFNFLFYILLLVGVIMNAHAGITGKISGGVVDKDSGEPLVGVNVFIDGFPLGASTGEDGDYYILQVPPGKYTLKASMMGYATQIIKNVQVQVDLTTTVFFELSSSILEGEEIVIIAEKPMIQKDLTSSKRSASKEEMNNIPNAEDALDVLSLIPGTVVYNVNPVLDVGGGHTLKAQDDNVKNVHIRGGGGGEVLFQVDGMPVTHPIFGGRSVLNIDIKTVEEIEVLTGGFNAEYGEAQSGVVNIMTREGRDIYKADLSIKSDVISSQENKEGSEYVSFYLEGPELITSKILPAMGLTFDSKTTMFLSGSARRTDTQFNNYRTRDTNTILGLFDVVDKQSNEYTFNFKIAHRISPSSKLIINYQRNDSWWSGFDWGAKNIPDSLGDSKEVNDYIVLSYNHTLSPKTFFNFNLSYLQVKYNYSLRGMTPDDFWRWEYNAEKDTLDYVGADFFGDINHDGFADVGLANDYRNDLSKVLTAKFDITSQITKTNLFKAGFEYQYKDLSYCNVQQGGWYLSEYGQYVFDDGPEVATPPGPYPEYGLYRWVFSAYPSTGSFFMQDKVERAGLIINAGLRYDWIMPGSTVANKEYIDQWEKVTGLELNLKKFRGYFSPRLGISFPISVKTVMYFSYGHFQQLPSSANLYLDPFSYTFCGDPNLEPQKTVAYEFGFAYQFMPELAIDIKGYSKDISNTVVSSPVQPENRRPIWLTQNMGYGRARGFEITLKKRYSNYTSGVLSYTMQWANGYTSSPYELYQRSQTNMPLPIREQRLDWDKRHQVLLQFTLSVPENRGPELFGIKIPDNWNMTINSMFSSGNPYTPGSTDFYVPPNSETGPYYANTDIRFTKTWNLTGIYLGITLDVLNLFDWKNTSTSYAFNNWTGQPFTYGDAVGSYPYYYTWMQMARIRDPRMFNQGRRLVLGFNIGF